jgi:hypothetical protein
MRPIRKIAETSVLENLLDNIDGRFFLENPAIGVAGEKPKPRYNLSLIINEAPISTGLGETTDVAVDKTVPLGAPDCNRDALPDNRGEWNRPVLGQECKGELERARDTFDARKSL